MQTLVNLECFVRSAETLSFSQAARSLSLTPAGVSRNVAALEKNLGVRLFHRSTRRLTLTEEGERLLAGIGRKLDDLEEAIAGATRENGAPTGTLRVSMPVILGLQYLLPLLPEFLERYPSVCIDWHLDNRPVELIGERFDVAIGGGFELANGVIARRLAPMHLVAVASPAYMHGRTMPSRPSDLAGFDGIGLRFEKTGRVSEWSMRNRSGDKETAALRPRIILNDPLPVSHAARAGLGVAVLAVSDVLHDISEGFLVRLLPDWHADLGAVSIYHRSPHLQPARTRAFIDFIAEQFDLRDLSHRFDAS